MITAALVFGLLVAGVHGQLKERIKRNAQEKLNREMGSLFGAGKEYEPVPDATDERGEKVLYYIARDEQGEVCGYTLEVVGSGFADKIKLLVAVDAKLEKLIGIAVLKSNETPGFGDKIKEARFRDQFGGCPTVKLLVVKEGARSVADEQIVAITGATVSSEAVTKIVNEGIVRLREMINH